MKTKQRSLEIAQWLRNVLRSFFPFSRRDGVIDVQLKNKTKELQLGSSKSFHISTVYIDFQPARLFGNQRKIMIRQGFVGKAHN